MKLMFVMLLAVLLLTGCGRSEVYETITDELVLTTAPEPREVWFDLGQEPVLPVMESDAGKVYLCGDFDVMVQTVQSGDLEGTVYQVSGFSKEELTLIQTDSGDAAKYEFVWTSVTDEGHQVGRATILDDGNYHYVLSATVDAELIEEYQEIWNGIFESFELV